MIDEDILKARGGVLLKFKKNQTIFFEGNTALFYHQIVEGNVKMVNINSAGKEFIQGMFTSGQSFGEPVLLTGELYPASAVASDDASVIKLNKESFLHVLKEFPEIHFNLTQLLAKRLYNKAIISKEIAIHTPEHRILRVLELFRKNIIEQGRKKCKVEISRQQIADMTGLRVETVIRAIKALERKDQVKIEKGKIYMSA